MPRLNPDRLREIRLIRGLTLEETALKLGISKQAVSKHEKGTSQPNHGIIDKAINFYKIPRSYLTKDSLEESLINTPLFFRTKKSTKNSEKEVATIFSKWVYEILSCMNLAETGEKVNIPNLGHIPTIAEKAMFLREHWNLGLGSIENLTKLLEKNGIVIICADAKIATLDAHSQIINGIPIILINKSIGSAARWRFSLAHELAHMVLHSSINWNQLDFEKEYSRLEDEANEFAENFLMPETSFANSVIDNKLDYFISLKKVWKVSIASIIYRCNRLNLIDSSRFQKLQKQLSKRGWRKNEPLDDELEHELPKRMSALLKKNSFDRNTADQLLTNVCLPIDIITKLCGVESDYFEKLGLNEENYMPNPEFKQLSLLHFIN